VWPPNQPFETDALPLALRAFVSAAQRRRWADKDTSHGLQVEKRR
jgi:hypothetical protein